MKFWSVSLLIIILQVISTARDFKGAEYRTKESFLYGRFEAKIKSPGKEGILCSLFTYYDGTGGISAWNEIDIEIMGRYNNQVQFNTITPNQINHVRHQCVDFDPSVDYHFYGFEWTPNYVAWFIDGVEVARQTGAHIQTLNRAQKLMMNLWNPTYSTWAGKWNPDLLPAFAYYDSVKYYSYTPGSGNSGTDNNFTLQWIDPMDSYNSTRWDRATHTFDGNNCDFVTNNITFQNNAMALCLTNSTDLGYMDITKPVPIYGRNDVDKVTLFFSEILDTVTALNKSNYIITGVTINSITIKENKRTVELNVSGTTPGLPYNVILRNIKDTFGNVMTTKSVSLINSIPFTFPIKINAGGTASMGYLPDQLWTDSTMYGYSEGSSSWFYNDIGNTTEDSIYKAERYGHSCYNIRVPNGSYNVKLMFAENYFTSAGLRVFDVFMQNKQVIYNLDIFQKVGKGNAYEFTQKNVIVTDGLLKINFAEDVDNALVNGIVVTQNATGLLNENYTPKEIELYQNYPNPFNGSTNFTFKLKKSEAVNLRIYNINGEKINSYTINGNEGNNSFYWNGIDNRGRKLSSGVYFYSLNGEAFNQTKKLIILN